MEIMYILQVGLWIFAVVGWMGDWATTVWPNKDVPEDREIVRRLFGKYPDPVGFGIAKILSLVLLGVVYQQMSLPQILLIPLAIGIAGWYATVHNFRLLFLMGE